MTSLIVKNTKSKIIENALFVSGGILMIPGTCYIVDSIFYFSGTILGVGLTTMVYPPFGLFCGACILSNMNNPQQKELRKPTKKEELIQISFISGFNGTTSKKYTFYLKLYFYKLFYH